MSRFTPSRVRTPPRTRAITLLSVLLVTLGCASGARAATIATPLTLEAHLATLQGWDTKTISDSNATDGTAVELGGNGAVQFQVQLPADANTLALRVRGDQCAGAPAYTITVDGLTAASDTAPNTTWVTKSYSRYLVAGRHTITVAYTNDYSQGYGATGCDRNLYLDTLALSASAAGPSAAPAAIPAIPAGYVHQQGTQVVDGAGAPLKLRGVNLAGWLSWEGWLWGEPMDYIGETAMMDNLTSLVGQTAAQQFQTGVYNNFITGADFHAMAEAGINVVRVPFNYRMLESDTSPYPFIPSGWTVLDNLINEAAQNNVYVILDMHVAPCSQGMGFTADYVPSDDALLWWGTSCEQRMVALWQAIAARYANDNVIAGYDLLNEPVTTNASLLSLYQRVTAAIRSVDPNHMIIYEGNDIAKDFTFMSAPLDPNEMLEIHDYGFENANQDLTARMPGYDAAATRLDSPIWFGEFGQGPYSQIQHYVSVFNADPLTAGWADWTWKQSPGYPAMATIQESPAAQMLINWIDNPSRPKPTLAQAQQGMSDFLNEIQFQNTLPDAELAQLLG